MSTIEKTVPFRFKSASPLGHDPDIVLEVGGVNIAGQSKRVSFTSGVGEIATAKVEMFAYGGFDVSFPAAVTVHIVPAEGGEIEAIPQGDGSVRYRYMRRLRGDD